MKEHPILFSAPMVRALLAGTKTQTRRALRVQPPARTFQVSTWLHPDPRPQFYAWWEPASGRPAEIAPDWHHPCPYGALGDRLWVRETWMDLQGTGVEVRTGDRSRYAYGADTPAGSYGDEQRKLYGLKWRPSIHMPRAVSRITLDVVGVRVERLQDISEQDAIAEGVTPKWEPGCSGRLMEALDGFSFRPAASAYADLWESINGAGSWAANPWVWVVEFKRTESPNARVQPPTEGAQRP